ncbi:MAG: plasmid stabilization protein [Actinobacteria bacterium]|nr:plasmid stabilization protein [Actinomycetota bacterium]
MASLTIRGLDEDLKSRLRLEAAKQGRSMEETARQILRRALMAGDIDARGLGTRVHSYFAQAEAFDLDLAPRSGARRAPDLSE